MYKKLSKLAVIALLLDSSQAINIFEDPEDGVKADKPEKIVYNHKEDIRQAYVGHLPKSKWEKAAPPKPEPREYTPEETAHRRDIKEAMTGHIPHIQDRNAKYDYQRKLETDTEPRTPTQISYDPYAKPPTYNLAEAYGDGEEDGAKVDKPEKIVYNHPEDIKQAYAGHFPKTKWEKAAPPKPEPREYTPAETAHRRDIQQAMTGHIPHIQDKNVKYDYQRKIERDTEPRTPT